MNTNFYLDPYGMDAAVTHIQNQALARNYQATLRSLDYRMNLDWQVHDACCDAYHIRNYPENIRCCMLGYDNGFHL